MKSLVQYIEESLKAEEMFITAIKDNKFTKEQIVSMLTNMDIKDIKKISDKFKQDYEDDYFAYEPSKDDFLKNNEKEKIAGKMADFCLKFICK